MNELQKKSLYGSHMPILARVLDATDGPVLELGMGIYSTPLIDLMCRETKRKMVSYDNDQVWFKENEKWASDYHEVHFVYPRTVDPVSGDAWGGWEDVPVEKTHWSVALVDHKPAKQRKTEIRRLAHCANFVIVHDTEPESDKFFKYSWVYKYFKYRYDYKKCRPNTTVLSNFVDLSSFLT